MKTAKTQSFLLALIFLCTPVLKAEQWKILGPRPMGMGGAFVAVAKGPIAQYWNPAGLAQDENVSGLEFPIGFRAEFTGDILENANKLGDLVDKYNSIQTAQEGADPIDADQMAAVVQGIAVLSSMNKPGNGLLADVEGGATLKLGKIAVSLNNFTSVGASPFIDTINIGLGTIAGAGGVTLAGTGNPAGQYLDARNTIESAITTIGYTDITNLICGVGGCAGITTPTELANALVNQAVGTLTAAQIQEAANIMLENAALAAPVIQYLADGDDNPYTNNTSNLTIRGASFTELAFGYAKPLLLPGLYVGGNFKLIFGKVGYYQFSVLQDDAGTSDALKDYTKNTKSSVRPGIDLGALLEVDKILPMIPWNLRAGLVLRNINNPKFPQSPEGKAAGESDYAHNGQVRGGLAVNPFNFKFWTLALDMDITNNLTPIPGYKSRQLGIGSEINVFNRPWINIPLRVGILKNLSDSSSDMAYTAGFGLNFMHFLFDIGGSISSNKVTSDEGDEIPSNLSVATSLALLF